MVIRVKMVIGAKMVMVRAGLVTAKVRAGMVRAKMVRVRIAKAGMASKNMTRMGDMIIEVSMQT
jgi:DnaJ-class molecular chaperone